MTGTTKDGGEADIYCLVVGRVVQSLRKEKQWTQQELCDRSGITQSLLSRSERGAAELGPYQIRALARAFDLTAPQLIDRVEQVFSRTADAVRAFMRIADEEVWWTAALMAVGMDGMTGLVSLALAAPGATPPPAHRAPTPDARTRP